ncbi:hypothetical protein EST35_0144 [Pseudomonas phage vB_PaeM_PA5oct]|uniref:Uncharacterized protein n=1 Tax=Pseudomonas phage vB_PaeM_PA5oct TaxID=2163605 RepID=A0A4Y1LUG0_9CAUD|nr:hypothetical protein PQE65_gp339 [Pseudomonas phage vB_PaeM_PA5oct]QCG76026.1 hypothetical protein EST35_0144 [Pseudomonas phage vB_PaeM_PA5oct]WPK39647.1 hypothetical protein Deiofobo_0450 [Pseudomonas phage Deifobo]WPK40168.1 hypothetical protein ETTORE_0459 [Pseudomonas phage Ettore]WPK40683.1 hypothetical protein Paride_0453 [Pseudomonas phage Paride]
MILGAAEHFRKQKEYSLRIHNGNGKKLFKQKRVPGNWCLTGVTSQMLFID